MTGEKEKKNENEIFTVTNENAHRDGGGVGEERYNPIPA